MPLNNLRSLLEKRLQQYRGSSSARAEAEDNLVSAILKSSAIQAGALLDVLPYPAAIWSPDRRLCVFNNPARQLFGFSEDDIRGNAALWVERIHPSDRSAYLSACKQLESGAQAASSKYRFSSKGRLNPLKIQEVALSCPIPGSGVSGCLTVYLQDLERPGRFVGTHRLRDLLAGLTHEIGNHLQAISGEIELLKWSGTVPTESAQTIASGISQIGNLAHEIQEYLFPVSHDTKTEDPGLLVRDITTSLQEELAASGIVTRVVLKEPLPKVPLDREFGKALKRVINFSRALLPKGGELTIEAGTRVQENQHYIELNVVSSSSSTLQVEESEVFRPFLKLNGYRVGLSMAVAQRILRRHLGAIVFHKEQSNRGVFSVLIRVPGSVTCPDDGA
jgi:nitrogen-specific signal transduction histidine kinase